MLLALPLDSVDTAVIWQFRVLTKNRREPRVKTSIYKHKHADLNNQHVCLSKRFIETGGPGMSFA